MATLIPNLSGLSAGLSGLGQGLSSGLQELASRKVNEMQRRERQSELYNALKGLKYSDAQARAYSLLPERDLIHAYQQEPQAEPETINVPGQPSTVAFQNRAQEQLSQLESKLAGLQNPQIGAAETAQEIGRTNLASLLGPSQAPQMPNKLAPINPNELIEQARLAGLNPTESKWVEKIAQINANEQIRRAYEPLLQSLKAVQATPIQRAQQANRPGEILEPELVTRQEQPISRAAIKKPITESEKERRQYHIETLNQQQLKPFNAMITAADNLKSITDEMENLLATGNVKTGLLYSRAPIDTLATIANRETQRFAQLSQALVNEKQVVLKGNPTSFRVSVLQESNPNLGLEINNLKDSVKDEAKTADRILGLQKIKREIIKENGGKEPANLLDKIMERAQKMKGADEIYRVGQVVEKLPNAADYPGMEGEYNGQKIRSVNGKWVKVK